MRLSHASGSAARAGELGSAVHAVQPVPRGLWGACARREREAEGAACARQARRGHRHGGIELPGAAAGQPLHAVRVHLARLGAPGEAAFFEENLKSHRLAL